MPGKCSIEIDITIIEKMLKDTEYEQQVKEKLQKIIIHLHEFALLYETIQEQQPNEYSYVCAYLSEKEEKLSFDITQMTRRAINEAEPEEKQDSAKPALPSSNGEETANAYNEIKQVYFIMIANSSSKRRTWFMEKSETISSSQMQADFLKNKLLDRYEEQFSYESPKVDKQQLRFQKEG